MKWKRYFLIPWVYAMYYNHENEKYIRDLINKDDQVILVDFVDAISTI